MAREPSALDRLRELEAARRAPAPAPAATSAGKTARRGLTAFLIAAASFLLIKGKVVLIAVLTKLKLLFVALKIGPLFTTAYTMVLAAWAYALIYGWPFAFGLVLLVLVHEIGHGLAAARVGVRVGAPVFVPFFGAFIALRGKPRSTAHEAVIAAGGPIVGSIAAAGCVGVSSILDGTGAGLMRVIGFYALVLNLFNLTPVWQLDGARMLAPVSGRAMLAGGAAALSALVVAAARTDHVNPIALIAVGALLVRIGIRIARGRRARAASSALEQVAEMERAAAGISDDVSTAARRWAAAVYFATLVTLVAAVQTLKQWLPEVP